MTPPLEQVIADWRENAQVLRRTGHQHDGDLIDQLLDEVVSASEEFVTWLTEDAAMLRSGRARRGRPPPGGVWDGPGEWPGAGRRDAQISRHGAC